MNKPAPKEPSMDEILSSIRQIIADDDAAAAPKRPAPTAGSAPGAPAFAPVAPAPQAFSPSAPRAANAKVDVGDFNPMPMRPVLTPPPVEAAPAKAGLSFVIPGDDADEALAPLALSPTQIVNDPEEEFDPEEEMPAAANGLSFESLIATEVEETPSAENPFLDPEDISFEPEASASTDSVLAAFDIPDAPSFEIPAAEPAPAPAFTPSFAASAPMPDPTLSEDIADKLLEPTTDAAVRHTFTRLNGLGLGNQGVTVESMLREMLRDMLRPMLKEWLDENLPTVVEHTVEKEIARISRGVE